jgi:hypothetical protein
MSVAIEVVARNRHSRTGWSWRGPAWRFDLEEPRGLGVAAGRSSDRLKVIEARSED